jgi:class 3 adenylate cyclase
MIWGNIGSSTLRRLDYTVIGDAVNVASRLQSAADKDQMLITENTYKKVKESFQCKKVGEKQMKNKKMPLVVYEVIS